MEVRDAVQADYPQIEAIHRAMGLDYSLPPLDGPLWFVRKAASEGERVIGGCFLRICAETYLWLDPSLSPRGKMATIQALQPEVLRAAWLNGLDDIEARIPQTVETRFQKRLTQLGWQRNREGWFPWTISTGGVR